MQLRPANKDLVGRFQAIPFAKTESFDLDHYVTDKSLAGLFYVLGQEEKRSVPTPRPGSRIS
jgi:hypothetical protein